MGNFEDKKGRAVIEIFLVIFFKFEAGSFVFLSHITKSVLF